MPPATLTTASQAVSAPVQSVTQRAAAKYFGRNSGPEFYFTQAFTPGALVTIPKNVPLLKPLWKQYWRLSFRMVIGTAAYTTVFPEAFQNLIRNMILRGISKRFASQQIWNVSGAMAHALPRLYRPRGASIIINGVRVTEDQLIEGFPIAGVFTGAVGTYDVEVFWDLNQAPIGVPDAGAAQFLLSPQDWNDTLQWQLQFGDQTDIGVPAGGTTVVFSTFGGGGGSGQVDMSVVYGNLGPLAGSIVPALISRGSQIITAPMQSAGQNIRILQLQNQKTLTVIFKRGTGTPPSFTTLSDFITTQSVLKIGNKPIRDLQFDPVTKDFYNERFQSHVPNGYLPISFLDGGNPLSYFEGDKLAGGAQFELDTNIIAPSGTNAAEVLQEQQYGDQAAVTAATS